MSVGAVVVAAGTVVVVGDGVVEPVAAGTVVGVVGVAGVVGATKGDVSPVSVAWLGAAAADSPVQARAAVQLLRAVAWAVPVSGCGRPLTSVAGRKVAEVMCLPMAVTRREPLSVSGALLS